ncbi:MAG: hypothetical protein Q9208_008074 [Pyrenodesmia sp. 3 TL-2023]
MRSTLFLLVFPLLSASSPQNPEPAPGPGPVTARPTVTVATTIITSSILATTRSSTTSSTTTSPFSSPPAPSKNSTSNSTSISTSASPSPRTTTTTDPNALTPSQRAANFALDYQRLLAAQRNNTLFLALQTASSPGNTPRASASAQQNSYIAALRTATGSVPQPAYITGLPADQRAYMESFNKQIAEIASVDFRGVATTSSSATTRNGTSSTSGNGGGQVGTPGPETPAVVSPSPPAAANSTSAIGMALGSQPTGVYKMAAGAAMGVLGVAVFL